jgi:hypothetical protein
MPTNLLRVDIDQRSREARLRIEQVERHLSRAALKRFRGQAAPLSLQRRHFFQRVAKKPD